MAPNHAADATGSFAGTLGGVVLGVVGYFFFSWGMASGLIPVPSKAAQRRGALALLVIAAALISLQVALVVWAQLGP